MKPGASRLVLCAELCRTLVLSFVWCVVAACGGPSNQADDEQARTLDAYTIQLTVNRASDLPACNATRAGTTAFVQSSSSLWSCVSNTWIQIPCTKALGGAVAYATAGKALYACTSGAWAAITVPTGPAGAPGSLVSIKPEPPGAGCSAGGHKINTGVDDDRDGVLDANEVDSSQYACNGATGAVGPAGAAGPAGAKGADRRVDSAAEPAGANCANGGYKLTFWSDLNHDGVRAPSEVEGTSWVCNGAEGPMGPPGPNGDQGFLTLIASADEPRGSNCSAGGVRLSYGVDENRDLILDASEVGATRYVCNGSSEPDPELPDPPTDIGTVEPNTVETHCRDLPRRSTPCVATPGTADGIVLEGTVLGAGSVYVGGQVAINGLGEIACVGCDCGMADSPHITCAAGVISPGLINAHDHLSAATSPAAITAPYNHRHDWRNGDPVELFVRGDNTQNHLKWAELRFLMTGATSIVGAARGTGIIRNLDANGIDQGLGLPRVVTSTFPLGDQTSEVPASFCAYPEIDQADTVAQYASYLAHVAEGVDVRAREEFLCICSQIEPGQNLLGPKTAIVQGVGLDTVDYALMAATGTSLVWSPRSNLSLYGLTSSVTLAAQLGIQIALGTDWIATGSMNLLRELQCAGAINRDYYNSFFTDEALWRMVTANAAHITAMDSRIGSLEVGKVADVAIFDATQRAGFRAVLEATPSDILLVLQGGVAQYGDADIVSLMRGECEPIDVCLREKSLCAALDAGATYAGLSVGRYPAFFCGTPDNEPSCSPVRFASLNGSGVFSGQRTPSDADGDGIPNVSDICPSVLDPIRAVDNGAQADADADGTGDACDPCPFEAQSCGTANPNDSDRDGIESEADNCPDDANTNQTDLDSDGKGDVCDECPQRSNPGVEACPAVLSHFEPAFSFVGVGAAATPSGTSALHVRLGAPAETDTFIPIRSSDPAALTVERGGALVLAGAQTTVVQLHAVAPSQMVTLIAAQDGIELQANVRVVAVDESPQLATLSPVKPIVSHSATLTMSIVLDIPAPSGGTQVTLSLTPATAGVVPSTLLVPAGQTHASFAYSDAGTTNRATVRATLGTSTAEATLTIIPIVP